MWRYITANLIRRRETWFFVFYIKYEKSQSLLLESYLIVTCDNMKTNFVRQFSHCLMNVKDRKWLWTLSQTLLSELKLWLNVTTGWFCRYRLLRHNVLVNTVESLSVRAVAQRACKHSKSKGAENIGEYLISCELENLSQVS